MERAYDVERDSTSDVRKRLLTAYQSAIGILPQIAEFGLDVASRLRALHESFGDTLGAKAALHALALNLPETAVELLEQSRTVFWSQSLGMRSLELELVPTGIAQELRSIFRELETGSFLAAPAPSEDDIIQAEKISTLRRRQSTRAFQIIRDIRQQPGRERFLLGQPLAALKKAAAQGPIVILLSTNHKCHAIIVQDRVSDAVHSLILPDMTEERLVQMGKVVQDTNAASLRDMGAETTHQPGREGAPTETRLTMRVSRRVPAESEAILGELWMRAVKPLMVALRFEVRLITKFYYLS
jgi:hypothetical protein